MRVSGSVKWFNARRGFGFICDEDGQEYFVHYSEIQMDGFKRLSAGQMVTFIVSEDEQGRSVAIEVKPAEEEEGA